MKSNNEFLERLELYIILKIFGENYTKGVDPYEFKNVNIGNVKDKCPIYCDISYDSGNLKIVSSDKRELNITCHIIDPWPKIEIIISYKLAEYGSIDYKLDMYYSTLYEIVNSVSDRRYGKVSLRSIKHSLPKNLNHEQIDDILYRNFFTYNELIYGIKNNCRRRIIILDREYHKESSSRTQK